MDTYKHIDASDAALAERFWSKVGVGKPDECWPWLSYTNRNGYGRFRVGQRRNGTRRLPYAHRVAYELAIGPIPDGLTLDHLCRNRPCVNPAHLEAVTWYENLMRGQGPAPTNAAKTHCKHGHEFTEDNAIVFRGMRQCRTCHNDLRRRQRAA